MKKYTIRKNVTVDDETLQQWQALAQYYATSESAVMRQLIREAYQKIQKEKPMNKVQQTQQEISNARGGCIAVRVYDVNGSGHIEAEIDPAAAKYCPCQCCKAGDLTTSA